MSAASRGVKKEGGHVKDIPENIRSTRESGLSPGLRRPHKPWRLIFNWDSGDVFGLDWWVTDPGAFRRRAIQSFLKAGADAVTLGLFTTDVVLHGSEYAEFCGQFHQALEDVRQWEQHIRTRHMIENGRCQMDVLTEQAHKVGLDVLASFRMNDTHDLYYSPENILSCKFKREHPELLIKDEQWWTKLCLDYAHKEVRDRRFTIIRETVDRFDVDGVELDFMRNGFFFRKGEEEANALLMTGLLQRIRAMLDEVSTSRGKRLHLAVHTPVTQAVSLHCGLDVMNWIQLGLVDHVIADEGCTPFCVAPDDFIKAAKGKPCRIYSTVDVLLGNPERSEEDKGCDCPGAPWTEEQLRGWAAFQVRGGVHGLNLFNAHHAQGAESILARLFGKDGSWENGFEGDKTFVVHNRSFTANMPLKAIPPIDWLPVPLKTATNGDGQEFDLFIADDIQAAVADGILESITLRVVFRQWTVEDELAIKVNGHTVAEFGRRDSARAVVAKRSESRIAEALAERLIPLDHKVVQLGKNTIKVVLYHRNPKIQVPLVWKNAEVTVRYREGCSTCNPGEEERDVAGYE